MKIKRQLIIALILIFAFVSLTVNIGSADAATSRVAIISKLEGTVEVQKSGGKKTLKGFKNMSLNEGDVVSTGSKSSVELKFSNGTSTDDTLVLESNTTVTFSKLSNRNGTVTKVKMKNGKAWVDVKSIENSSDDFQLETPTSVMGVRGTNFFVGIDPSTGKSVLAMFSGVVKLLSDEDNYQQSRYVYPAQIFYTARDGELLGNMSNDSIAQLLQNTTPAAIASVIENLQKIKEENDQLLDQLRNGEEAQAELDENLQALLTNDVLRTNIERITAALLKEAVDKKLITVAQQTTLLTQLFGEEGKNQENELVGNERNNTYDFILNERTKEMLDQLNKSNLLEEKKAQLLAEQERKKQALEEEKKKREQEALDKYLNNLTPTQRDVLLQARDRIDRGTVPTATPAVTIPSTPSQPAQGWSSVAKPFKVTYDDGATAVQLQYNIVSAINRTFQLNAPLQAGADRSVKFEPSNDSMTITSIKINGETFSPQENGSYIWYLPEDSLEVVVTIGMNHTTYGNAEFTLQGEVEYDATEVLPPIIDSHPAEEQTVTLGGTIELSVEAHSADNGALSYQWYRSFSESTVGGSMLAGETSNVYSAEAFTVGTAYYYVVVTNTINGASGELTAETVSNIARVIVEQEVTAAEPNIITHPIAQQVTIGNTLSLAVAAQSLDGGQLSYQWYKTNDINEDGEAIQDAVYETYTETVSDIDTSYYYVIVTNTKGTKTAQLKSDVVLVEVSNPPIHIVHNDGEAELQQNYSYSGENNIFELDETVRVYSSSEMLNISSSSSSYTISSVHVNNGNQTYDAFEIDGIFQLAVPIAEFALTIEIEHTISGETEQIVIEGVGELLTWESLGIPFTVSYLGDETRELQPIKREETEEFEYYVEEPIIVSDGDQLDIAAASSEFTINSVFVYGGSDEMTVEEVAGHYTWLLDPSQWNPQFILIEVTHKLGTQFFYLDVNTRTVPEGWETIENPIQISITSSEYPSGKSIPYNHYPFGYEFIYTTEAIYPTDDTVVWFNVDATDYRITSIDIEGEVMTEDFTWRLSDNTNYLYATVTLEHDNEEFGEIDLELQFKIEPHPELFPVTFYLGDENRPLYEYEQINYYSYRDDSTEYIRYFTFHGSLVPSMDVQRYLYLISEDYYITKVERDLGQGVRETLTEEDGGYLLELIAGESFQFWITIWDSAKDEERVYFLDEFVFSP